MEEVFAEGIIAIIDYWMMTGMGMYIQFFAVLMLAAETAAIFLFRNAAPATWDDDDV